VARAARRGVQARSALVDNRGFPIADLIVEYAQRWKADVIVLGTHGRRGFSHLLMGSDAESVVRSSTIPVLLVRSADGAGGGRKAAAKGKGKGKGKPSPAPAAR
jgi:nucleotide-binding universal stress UspA family protein